MNVERSVFLRFRKAERVSNPMHVSARKLLAILCVLTVSTVGVVFAATMFKRTNSNISAVTSTNENAADVVTIYGNGVTFIRYAETVALGNGASDIQFYLPFGALTDTLTVSGINVLRIATSNESYPTINSGDIITVTTQNGAYTGKFISWDTMLLLEADNGTIMIPTTSITKIVLNEVVQVQGPKILVDVITDSPPGNYQMNISYLMRGPLWSPTYFVDLDTSYMQCWATIENVENWNNFTLVLVSGGPHIVYYNPTIELNAYIHRPMITYAELALEFAPTTTDEYHEYTYNSKLSFQEGTTVKLSLFNGTVGLRQEYFWTDGDVQNRYHINDTTSEPLATGTVEFYHGSAWVGEDSIAYVPVNSESIAVVNYADDIKATATVTKSISQSYYYDQGTNITITNYKHTSISILIQQDTYGYTLVTSTPSATNVGSTLSWTINLKPNETTTIYYEWEHN
ncbi:MAG: hypothetical protein ABR962_04910 [Candidatus Bathyarchaeia archaeon]|jgi:hypothetical protein